MEPLELISKRQASWSTTANQLKATLDRVRSITFALSIGGAVLASVASQQDGETVRRGFAIAGAIALAVATFLAARLAAAAQVAAWTRARAVAEALKREAFKFAVRAAPYDDAGAPAALIQEKKLIEDGADDLIGKLVDTGKVGSAPSAIIAPEEYINKRVKGQIQDYYRKKADEFSGVLSRLRKTEFVLALAATVLTAIVGTLQKYPVSGFHFDLAALTAVLTTVAALILTHIEASKYEFLVTTYRATARRLEDALLTLPNPLTAPSKQWSEFVERCEAIIAAENNSWVAKWVR